MPLIVLEGPEGSGKTTLARAIESMLVERDASSVQYIHNGPPDPPLNGVWTEKAAWEAHKSMVARYVAQYDEAAVPPWKWTIIDRAHLSEIVYAHRRRGESEDWNPALDHWLHVRAWTPYSRQRLYVLCGDPQVMAARETNTEFPAADVIHRLDQDLELFYRAYRRTSWPAGILDLTHGANVEAVARSIIEDEVQIKTDSWQS